MVKERVCRTPAGGGGARLTKSVSLSSQVRSDVEPRPEGENFLNKLCKYFNMGPVFSSAIWRDAARSNEFVAVGTNFIVSDLFGRTCKHVGIKRVGLISFDVSI